MKSIFISLLFFFGPVLLMFALRYIGLLVRFWLLWRRQKRHGPDVIDITPRKPHPPSIRFVILAIAVGLIIAGLVWNRLSEKNEHADTYVPAHVNQEGHLVPGHFQKQ